MLTTSAARHRLARRVAPAFGRLGGEGLDQLERARAGSSRCAGPSSPRSRCAMVSYSKIEALLTSTVSGRAQRRGGRGHQARGLGPVEQVGAQRRRRARPGRAASAASASALVAAERGNGSPRHGRAPARSSAIAAPEPLRPAGDQRARPHPALPRARRALPAGAGPACRSRRRRRPGTCAPRPAVSAARPQPRQPQPAEDRQHQPSRPETGVTILAIMAPEPEARPERARSSTASSASADPRQPEPAQERPPRRDHA